MQSAKTDIPHYHKNKDLIVTKVMEIELLKKYDKKDCSFNTLKEFGVTAIRGPRSMPEKLSKFINEKYK